MTKQDWTNNFPLDTFQGETKKQLVECISSILAQKDKERNEVIEGIKGEVEKNRNSIIGQLKMTQDGMKYKDFLEGYKTSLEDFVTLLQSHINP